jgi:DNA-binding response OmpR family regulator
MSFGFELTRAAEALGGATACSVAEDDSDFYASLAADLRAAGYRVRRAICGDEALEMVAIERPSVIVLDLVLPGRDGWEVLKELKADPKTAGVPVIIVSLVENHELGFALGADDYFLKPLDRERFLERVRELAPAAPNRRRPAVLVIDDDHLARLPRPRARGAGSRCSRRSTGAPASSWRRAGGPTSWCSTW